MFEREREREEENPRVCVSSSVKVVCRGKRPGLRSRTVFPRVVSALDKSATSTRRQAPLCSSMARRNVLRSRSRMIQLHRKRNTSSVHGASTATPTWLEQQYTAHHSSVLKLTRLPLAAFFPPAADTAAAASAAAAIRARFFSRFALEAGFPPLPGSAPGAALSAPCEAAQRVRQPEYTRHSVTRQCTGDVLCVGMKCVEARPRLSL